MKKLSALLIMLALTVTLSAQQQDVVVKKQGGMMKANPEMLKNKLTEDQQQKISAFKIKLEKESLLINNELREKMAQLKSLQQLDKTSLKDINNKIDEITALHNKKMKAMAENRNNVRSLLTDEQRLKFDQKMNMGHKNGKKMHKQFKMRAPEAMRAPMGQNGMMQREIEIRQIKK